MRVRITFSSRPSRTERIYGVVTDGPVPDRWLAKKIPPIDAWVAGIPECWHQVLSFTREENLLRMVTEPGAAAKWAKKAAVQAGTWVPDPAPPVEDDDTPLSKEAQALLQQIWDSTANDPIPPYKPDPTDEVTTLGEDGVERVHSPRMARMRLRKGLVAAYYSEGEKNVSWQLGVGINRTDFIHMFGPPITEAEVRAMVVRMHDDPSSATELLELDANDLGWHLPEQEEDQEQAGVEETMASDDPAPEPTNPPCGVEDLLKRSKDLLRELYGDDEDEEGMDAEWYRRRRRIREIVDPKFKERILVWNGHHKDGEYFYATTWWKSAEERLRTMFRTVVSLNAKDFARLEEAEATGALLDPPVLFKGGYPEVKCPFCGELLRFGYDGQRMVVVAKPCPNPNGLVTEWDLNVPSGKLVIANNLCHWFPTSEDPDINTLIGCHQATLAAAKVGMAYAFVGNTCPSVFRDDDKFVIGSYPDEIEDEETGETSENPIPCPWGERVAGICTDLWWYSIADHDELQRRIAYYTPKAAFDWGRVDVVDVKPGVYHFRHPAGKEEGSPVVYATFEWVREPDPLVDYLAAERSANATATEVLIEHCLLWPTLYMGLGSRDEKGMAELVKMWEGFTHERKVDCLARAANQIMCVLGGGVDWHENGFPRTVVSEEAKRLAKAMGVDGVVPAFQDDYDTYAAKWRSHHQNRDSTPPKSFERHWYPISEGGAGLCLGAGIRSSYSPNEPRIHLAPTFVLLGLNICQNAILYGEEPRLNHDVWPPAFEIPFCRERMKLFIRCYRGLREWYPELVFDASFDRRMQVTDMDSYVDRFDFGPPHPPKDQWGPPPATIKQGGYFEFDARKLQDDGFCWNPRYRAGWASKKEAQRYCLSILADTKSPMGHIHMEDASCRGPATVPLWVVGRIVRGTDEGCVSRVLEVAFDYGTPDMRNQRFGIKEDLMASVRQFNDPQEYQALLEKCREFFALEEAKIDILLTKT